MGQWTIPADNIQLASGKKIYFASDFHLGVPDAATSLQRERLVVEWLGQAQADAQAIYFLGDIFDFWFEYTFAIPRGYIRLQGKLAELRDAGIAVYFFTGNHDMWMFDYFPRELGIPIYREPRELHIGHQKLLIGHGDGLGPGEPGYKILKAFFNSSICQWLFARIHPNLGMRIAMFWSKRSRIANIKREETFKGEQGEYLFVWPGAGKSTHTAAISMSLAIAICHSIWQWGPPAGTSILVNGFIIPIMVFTTARLFNSDPFKALQLPLIHSPK